MLWPMLRQNVANSRLKNYRPRPTVVKIGPMISAQTKVSTFSHGGLPQAGWKLAMTTAFKTIRPCT
jgi:hypothetical protein